MRLLRVEWLKLRGYKPFWWILAAYPLALGAATHLMLRVQSAIMAKNAGGVFLGNPPFQFPQVWHTVAYVASLLHFLPCLLIMLSICNEFQFRTHRQNLLDGWSRRQFFLAKLLLSVVLCVVCTLFVGLLSVVVGISQGSELRFDKVAYLGLFFVQLLSYALFSIAISFWLQKGLQTMAFFLLYSKLLENIAAWLIGRQIPVLGYCTPLESANQLLPFPVFQNVAREFSKDRPPDDVLLLVAAFWMLVYLGVTWLWFRRRDL